MPQYHGWGALVEVVALNGVGSEMWSSLISLLFLLYHQNYIARWDSCPIVDSALLVQHMHMSENGYSALHVGFNVSVGPIHGASMVLEGDGNPTSRHMFGRFRQTKQYFFLWSNSSYRPFFHLLPFLERWKASITSGYRMAKTTHQTRLEIPACLKQPTPHDAKAPRQGNPVVLQTV